MTETQGCLTWQCGCKQAPTAPVDEYTFRCEQHGGRATVGSVRVSLASWLLEQIDADEKRCKDRKDGYDTWAESWHTGRCGWVIGELEDPCTCSVPARVLAECAAKRKIIEAHHDPAVFPPDDEWAGRPMGDCPDCRQSQPCNTLRLLALPYASEPGYEESWRP